MKQQKFTLQEIFARNLKERRRKRGLTQAQLAEQIGVSTSFITEIETTRKAPSFNTIERISRYLEVPSWTFFCEEGDMLPENSTPTDQLAYKFKQEIGSVIEDLFKELK